MVPLTTVVDVVVLLVLSGATNDAALNAFNDVRLMLRINCWGNPEIVEAWEATTEPGRYYTLIKKLDPLGAARSSDMLSEY